jgi:hypothetical protein
MALSGQLTVFQVYRRSALHSLDWDTVDAERLALLKRVIRQQTEALLRSLTSRRDARPVAQSTLRGSRGPRGGTDGPKQRRKPHGRKIEKGSS